MANEVNIVVTSTDKTDPGIDAAKKNVKELTATVTEAGQVMLGVLASDLVQGAAQRASQFIKGSIQAASDLEQAVGGTKAVFKEVANEIDKFAETAHDSVGLSENDFRTMATQVGGQLKRMTGDVQFAADKTIQLTKVAADLAATYGGTTKEAMESFSAALRGEADPAERFNLDLKVSAVNAKAVELGLAKTELQVSSSAKAQALYALILDQSTDAQGQFNRETDSAAHKQQVANARMEDAKAALGEGLIPLYSAAADAVGTLADGFSALPTGIQASIALVLGLGTAFLVLVPKIHAARVAAAEMNLTLAGTRAFLAGPWGLAIGAAIALIAGFSMANSAAKGRVKELADALDFQTDALNENNRATIAKRLEDAGLLQTARELGISTQDLTDAILGDTAARDRLNLTTIHLNKNSDEATVKQFKFNQQIKEMTGDVEAAKGSQDRLSTATGKTAAKTDDAAEAAAEYREEIQKQNKAVQDAFDPMANLIHRLEDVKVKQQDYTDAVHDHGRKSAEAQRAELELASAIIDASSAAANATGTFTGKLDPALKAILRTGGMTEAELRDIEKQFNAARIAGDRYAKNYPATATLRVVVHDSGYAEYRAGERNPSRMAGGPIGAASGGNRGGGTVINEYGQGELVHMPDGSVVIPHGQSTQMLYNMLGNGGGGGGKMQLEISMPRASGLAWMDSLIEGLRYKVSREGNGDVQSYLGRS